METEKMIWGNPEMDVQQFTPQEFVAVCEDRDTWGATCVTMQSHNRGYIFYDHDMDGVVDPDDLRADGHSEHGGCGRTHYFHSTTRPSFNGWVLSESTLTANNLSIDDVATHSGGGWNWDYILKEEYKGLLTPALIREPGDVFDNNWLVCINLEDLRNPS